MGEGVGEGGGREGPQASCEGIFKIKGISTRM